MKSVLNYQQSLEVISYPEFNLPFVTHCDTLQTRLGAVLYQNQMKNLNVISFASRTVTPAVKNYHLHSGKLEFLALKWAVKDLNYRLPFEVFTANNPFTYVMTSDLWIKMGGTKV